MGTHTVVSIVLPRDKINVELSNEWTPMHHSYLSARSRRSRWDGDKVFQKRDGFTFAALFDLLTLITYLKYAADPLRRIQMVSIRFHTTNDYLNMNLRIEKRKGLMIHFHSNSSLC